MNNSEATGGCYSPRLNTLLDLYEFSFSAIFSDCLLLFLITSCTFSDCCSPSIPLACWLFWQKKNVTWISLKYIKWTPCIRPKFVPTFCVNLLCLLFTLLAAIGWQTVNLHMNQTVKYQGAFSTIAGFSGKRFLPSPSSFTLRSSISFAFPPTQ